MNLAPYLAYKDSGVAWLGVECDTVIDKRIWRSKHDYWPAHRIPDRHCA